MPFTLAHPAAVVPLKHRKLDFSALVIGSMAPDFNYFLRLPHLHGFTHTIPGIFAFCFPLSLIGYWIFHNILKAPLISLLPLPYQQCLTPPAPKNTDRSLPRLISIIASTLIGSATHILWDAFTHLNGWFVQQIPLLARSISIGPIAAPELYKILQHGSTFAGMLLLLYWHLRWIRRVSTKRKIMLLPFWRFGKIAQLSIITLFTMFLAVITSALVYPPTAIQVLPDFAREFVINSMSILVVCLFIYSLIWRMFTRGRQMLRITS